MTQLLEVLERRARLSPAQQWSAPRVGSRIDVEVADVHGVGLEWREGVVTFVSDSGNFQAHVQEPDGSFDPHDPFLEWFSQADEGREWRRRLALL